MLLAELLVHHTRRHMPTRRVALGSSYLPMSGPAHGAALAGAIMARHLDELDEDQREELPNLLAVARRSFDVPRIALHHRLQTDVHGLDRSRHRLLGEEGRLVLEIDVHGAPIPQILGAVLAVAALPANSRRTGLDALQRVLDGRFRLAAGVEIREITQGPSVEAPRAGVSWRPGGPPGEELWGGVPSDRRWAMEVLGIGADGSLEPDEINRRFRRLLRAAHPDHGGSEHAAAERIAELTEAREMLLAFSAST